MTKTDDFIDQVLKQSPSRETLFLILRKMKEEGMIGEVIRECIKALDIYPNDIPIRTLLSEAYMESGFIGPAETELQRAVADIALLIPAFKLQAGLYARQGRNEEALDSLNRYLAHYPDDQEALELLEEIRPAEPEPMPVMPDIAEEPISLIAEEGASDRASLDLAEGYYEQGDVEKAIDVYQDLLIKDPYNTTAADRLTRLSAQDADNGTPVVSQDDKVRAKKQRLVEILEEWRTRFQELRHVSEKSPL
ncbi:MAG: tetratricopeptide repeat protein [Desulfatiglans sp.]|jgi:tetratricopeptide (TPR) repeat protein|nr:tetratricopeptide repeat protein [Thermodesulfobacteriota bacterium]MEE4354586.1 tetratricopeptide repeat protein [Desulfatiglans sp.]